MTGCLDGSGISWTICKQSSPRSVQKTTSTPHHSIFYRPDALPDAQPTVSKHWRQNCQNCKTKMQHTIAQCKQHSLQQALHECMLISNNIRNQIISAICHLCLEIVIIISVYYIKAVTHNFGSCTHLCTAQQIYKKSCSVLRPVSTTKLSIQLNHMQNNFHTSIHSKEISMRAPHCTFYRPHALTIRYDTIRDAIIRYYIILNATTDAA